MLNFQSCYCGLQAERWGAELYTEDVESIDLSQRPFTIRTSEQVVGAEPNNSPAAVGGYLAPFRFESADVEVPHIAQPCTYSGYNIT